MLETTIPALNYRVILASACFLLAYLGSLAWLLRAPAHVPSGEDDPRISICVYEKATGLVADPR